ncbi:hypothetical protein MARI_31190 [Marinobacter sp. JH2]|nr:phosphopantetheine-binding protein [Marinobacter sp. JH2]QBM18976.1 hypothetical protein MARI_31190 [Marinobacter sp. JH2]
MRVNRHAAIKAALQQHLPNARLSAFTGSARLNADLAIDSIMLLQLIVHLELEHGFNLPEETLLTQELETVDDLARLLVANDHKEPSL